MYGRPVLKINKKIIKIIILPLHKNLIHFFYSLSIYIYFGDADILIN